ncbi:hypothetical protein Rs2_50197 [Raphanus sativus]|nr:hypothetical protein Rs2_50197 [Raphanus sativus]
MELLGEMQQYKASTPCHHSLSIQLGVFSRTSAEGVEHSSREHKSSLWSCLQAYCLFSHHRHVEEEAQPIRNSLRMIASKLDVLPGDEFRVAYEETVKFGSHVIVSAGVVCIGIYWRPINMGKIPLWHKVT